MKKMEPKQKKACEDLRREFGMSARYFNWRSQEDSNDQDWTPVNQANAMIRRKSMDVRKTVFKHVFNSSDSSLVLKTNLHSNSEDEGK